MGIPITIVSGFLGAGKTTLINQVLAQTGKPTDEILIIENEFGETGIDHQLLLHEEERILQLNNGCMCCSLRSDLIATLTAVLEVVQANQQPIKQIILETTGIADPQPIVQTLLTAPQLRGYYYIDSLLTVIDPAQWFHLSQEAAALKQIAMADKIFIREAGQKMAPQNLLKEINPLAEQIVWQKDSLKDADFFDLDSFHAPLDAQTAVETSHVHEHHHTHHGFHTMLLEADKLAEPAFIEWLDWLLWHHQEKFYRIKGILTFATYEFATTLQGVNQQVSFQQTTKPAIGTKIVLIGKDLPEVLIRQTFKQTFATESLMKEGR